MHFILSYIILIFLIILIVETRADTNPPPAQCTPKPADKQYEDVTFVFVLNKYYYPSEVAETFHVLSQIACEIPIADNIKGYVMFYGAEKLKEVKVEDFVDSKILLTKLQEVRDTTVGYQVTKCNEYKSRVGHFTNSEKFKSRKDLYYIRVAGNPASCVGPLFPVDRLHILYKSYDNEVVTIKSTFGVFNVERDLTIDLVDVRSIYKRIVQDGLRVLLPKIEEPEASNDWGGYLIGGIIGLLVGAALGVGGYFLHKKLQKKKTEKNKPPGKSTGCKKKPSKV